MRRLCLSTALLILLVILVDSTPLNIHHIQDEGTKIIGNGASILTGLAEIVKKALKGQVMILGIQFDNHTQEELPTLEIEYSTLSEEIKGVETIHKQGIEKRAVLPVVKGILGGVLKGVKIFGKGASILTGLAEIIKKALKGQVMISGIQFDNHTPEELPTLEIEYSTLSEENEGMKTSHKHGLEKRSVREVFKKILGGVIKGSKIVGKGASILGGLAKILNETMKDEVMISRIQFYNHTQEELPTLKIEYAVLSEENKGVETIHKQGIEKRAVLPVLKVSSAACLKVSRFSEREPVILIGLAEIVKKALKGQVMISGIQFDNHTQEEMPTLQIEYSTLIEENKGVETSHKQRLEKRAVLPVVKGILGGVLKGVKIFGQGASVLTGLAEIIKKALKGQVMISGIQFDNHTQEELPTLKIEYSTLIEENKGVETSQKRVLEKRSVVHVVKSILGGVIKGTKIFGKGASILTGLAEIVKKALKGQVMISRIQFDNHTQEELPTLNMEYSTLNEENKVSPAFMPAFCVEPKFVGVCNASMTRYFYNAQTGHCELFVYSGCGGNENNFPTLEECMKTCYPKAQSL
ncbi:LOW QUALITY PROTEIN: trophoblast Kunitz domain protein 1-like [Bos indicus x Bos taurus]|uniref:LOW QUALITY PROTEIN: trophoblast Kunitz domain protein 1-like n=1 Tax=Bos indicus x Bos taurus TaxID=30522 RepID=UPI000F7D1E9F|nr:LOW QUALITY PROTEIN: trophoblast Kunitz domain protein 1-like [Bos indicus x Bos taurus]